MINKQRMGYQRRKKKTNYVHERSKNVRVAPFCRAEGESKEEYIEQLKWKEENANGSKR